MGDVTPDLVALIARHLDLATIVRASAVNSTFRKGCYDRPAVYNAISHGRSGGQLTGTELQYLLKLTHVATASLAHTHYSRLITRPRGYRLFDASVVAAAMHSVAENERLVSWKPKPVPPTIHKRVLACRGVRRGLALRSSRTVHADVYAC